MAEAADVPLPHQAPDGHDCEEPAQFFPPFAEDAADGVASAVDRDALGLFLGREIPARVVEPVRKLLRGPTRYFLFWAEMAMSRTASFSEISPLTYA